MDGSSKSRWILTTLFAGLAFSTVVVAMEAQQLAPGGAGAVAVDPEASLPYSAGYSAYPAVLGHNAVTVFVDLRGTGGAKRYFTAPYLLADWSKFGRDINAKCAGKPENESVIVYLDVQFASKAVADQVVAEIEKENPGQQLAVSSLLAYPTVMMVVQSGGVPGIPERVRWRYPDIPADVIKDQFTVNITPHTVTEAIQFDDTCKQLFLISTTPRSVRGYFYAKNNAVKVDTLVASYSGFIRDSSFQDLLNEESQTGGKTATSRGKSGGFGLNFGKIFGGSSSSKQTAEAVDSRRRVVTVNLIQEAASDYAKRFAVTYRTEMATDGLTDSQIAAKITEFVTANAAAAEVEFRRTENGYEAVIDKTVSRALGTSVVDELLKSSGKPSLIGKDFTSVAGSGGGVDAPAPAAQNGAPPAAISPPSGGMGGSAVSQQDASFTDERSIEWQRKENAEWVPVRAKLHYVSEKDLSSNVESSFQRVVVSKTSGLARTEMVSIPQRGPGLPNQSTVANLAPEKLLRNISPGIYKSEVVLNGTVSAVRFCAPELEKFVSDEFTQIGGELEETSISQGDALKAALLAATCLPPSCRDGREHCRLYARSAGCFVSTSWLSWYTYNQRGANAVVEPTDICTPAGSPEIQKVENFVVVKRKPELAKVLEALPGPVVKGLPNLKLPKIRLPGL